MNDYARFVFMCLGGALVCAAVILWDLLRSRRLHRWPFDAPQAVMPPDEFTVALRRVVKARAALMAALGGEGDE